MYGPLPQYTTQHQVSQSGHGFKKPLSVQLSTASRIRSYGVVSFLGPTPLHHGDQNLLSIHIGSWAPSPNIITYPVSKRQATDSEPGVMGGPSLVLSPCRRARG